MMLLALLLLMASVMQAEKRCKKHGDGLVWIFPTGFCAQFTNCYDCLDHADACGWCAHSCTKTATGCFNKTWYTVGYPGDNATTTKRHDDDPNDPICFGDETEWVAEPLNCPIGTCNDFDGSCEACLTSEHEAWANKEALCGWCKTDHEIGQCLRGTLAGPMYGRKCTNGEWRTSPGRRLEDGQCEDFVACEKTLHCDSCVSRWAGVGRPCQWCPEGNEGGFCFDPSLNASRCGKTPIEHAGPLKPAYKLCKRVNEALASSRPPGSATMELHSLMSLVASCVALGVCCFLLVATHFLLK